jgi:FKBP-type peptidyl-prolyl cis-trans isomerase 2
LQEGDDLEIKDDYMITVNYEAWQPGREDSVDSTYVIGEPFRYRVGRRIPIRGFEDCVRSMRRNEVAKFYVEPERAFKPLNSYDGPVHVR